MSSPQGGRLEKKEEAARIRILSNPVQEYEWGSKTALQEILGEHQNTEKPMAELWMGAHPKASSKILVDDEWRPLNEAIEKNSESILGKDVAKKFSSKLPFLFKILAAARPLSIQVHPNAQQAMEGFARENRLGISLRAPDRNYKDQNHKPEIIYALTAFHGLKGFREIEGILDLVGRVCPATLSTEFHIFKKKPDVQGLKQFFFALITMGKEEKERTVTEAVSLAEKFSIDDPAYRWMITLNRAYPGDIGVLAPLYLNLIELDPGEALYVAAGELHSYLGGVGVELMASSDNVLRGGLTPKHIDLSELLRIVNFKVEKVQKVRPVNQGACEKIFLTSAEEFLLSVISVRKGLTFTSRRDRSVEILVCTEGEGCIKDLVTGETLTLTRGKSVVVPAALIQYRINGEATIHKASVPV